jgi:mono/diheme cytochrome c family protein
MRMIIPGIVGLLLTATVEPAPPKPADLAIQAREILHRRCFECHDGTPRGKAGLNVLDHVQLLDGGRKLVLPGRPDRSRLLELIEDGSMPQKAQARLPEAERQILRAWVNAGAPPFFRSHSESYVLARILEDARRLGPGDRPYVRYLSLHHLLTASEPRTDLDAHRAALERLVQHLAKAGAAALTAVEPTETVFRLDLRRLGWHEPLLSGKPGRAPLQPLRLNRFDLLLLDYPYAVLPDNSDDYAALGKEFLEQAQQVRPIPVVRGDWFIDTVLSLLGKPAAADSVLDRSRRLFEKPLDLAAAQAELDWARPLDELQKTLALPAFEKLALLAGGGVVRRDTWETQFAPLVRQLRLGTPVLPLDNPARPDYPPEPPFRLQLSAQDPKEKAARTRFAPGDQVQIVVESERDLYIEVIWTTARGKAYVLNLGNRLVKAGQAVRLGPVDKSAYTIGDDRGKEQITLFACEAALLNEEKDFPAGEVLQGKELPERVVHPFYAGWYDHPPRRLDPARMVKKTITIEIR